MSHQAQGDGRSPTPYGASPHLPHRDVLPSEPPMPDRQGAQSGSGAPGAHPALATSLASLEGRHLLLFDGACGLCDASVRWLMRRDRHARICFAPLQGETSARLMREGDEGLKATLARNLTSSSAGPADLDTVVFVHDVLGEARVYVASRAVLAALGSLGAGWSLMASMLRLVPRPVADACYRFVAKRRHRFFPPHTHCSVPEPSERRRMLP